VAEQARALGDSGTVASLRQFVHWLRTQASEGARIAEAVANEPDDDAVRILTIHASKGLEFPIVILAGLGVLPNNNAPRVAWTTAAGGEDALEVRTGRMNSYFQTPGFEDCRQTERQHSFLERDRLFYVAATRARERLVVSAFHKPFLKVSHADRHREQKCCVAECIEALRPEFPHWRTLQHGMAIGPGISAAAGGEDTAEAREAWITERARLLQRHAKARVIAATAIAHDAPSHDWDVPEEVPEPETDVPPWKKGRAGTSVGRAVHAVLQTIDLASGDGLAETANTQAVAEGIADEAARITRLAESARTSPTVQAAVASGKFWRELYVGASIDGVLVEGFIDLLYESVDGLVLVDYKTDSARDPVAIDRAMERYRLQGAAYALVLEQALGRPVAGCVFVFSEPRTERAVTDMPAAMAEVRVQLAARFTPAGR
jgi:ATP-dependent helicase/nuclease subunit A